MPGTTTPSDKKLDKILEKLEDLEIKIEETKSENYNSGMMIRSELQEESRNIKRMIKKVQDNQDIAVKLLDQYLQETRKRVKRIEEHLDLPLLAA